MADNVQPDAGEQREASSSGLFISTDPLQDEVSYKLAAGDADSNDSDNGDDDDYDSDNGDSDNGDSDNGDDSGPLVVEIGPGAGDGRDADRGDADDGETDPDYSDR